ncbi:MAG: nucleotidyl transferase AbiEii/AbiGii toxin family protein [Acidobacteria bacterium]|nr:nucleotidyl transferase AbiEii/AbiGii toxin family protein [Acidobacteriota bacterium]
MGFGDAIAPEPEELEFPTLLNSPAPKLRAYPKESVVAEKFEAIVKLGMANSRMKDFYDLWVLAQRFEFESATLMPAIQTTFRTRGTPLTSSMPLAFTADFHQLPSKQTQWKAFLRKSGLKADSSLEETIEVIREFVMPAAGSFFLGPSNRPLRLFSIVGLGKLLSPVLFSTSLYRILSILPLILLTFWLIRVRFTNVYKRQSMRCRRDVYSLRT